MGLGCVKTVCPSCFSQYDSFAICGGIEMRRFVEGADRQQSTLFPECLEDWICEDNPVRVIDVFVDELDLAELKFEAVVPQGHWPALVSSFGAAQALHLRLSQPGSVEPPT